MDRYFVQYFLLDEWMIAVLLVGSLGVGAVAMALLTTTTQPLRRTGFLTVYAVYRIGMLGIGYGFFLYEPAAELGLLGLLLIAIHLGAAAMGAMLYLASARRALDAFGTSKHAWMGFIAIAYLFLMLKKTKKHDEQMGTGAQEVGKVALVTLSVFAIIAGKIGEKQLDHDIEAFAYHPGSTLVQLLQQNMTVAQSWQAQIDNTRLPFDWDDGVTLTSLTSDGTRMSFGFEVVGEDTQLVRSLRDDLAYIYCAPDMFARELSQGGELGFAYRDSAGKLLQEFVIDDADCL